MILREFLYVDTDKVRGMLAQLDGGIAESQRTTEADDRQSDIGVKGYLGHQRSWEERTETDKSLGDALFPTLEEALETTGILSDISSELTASEYWDEALRDACQPGAIVRISAMGALFDSRYVATSLEGFATAYLGVEALTKAESHQSGGQVHSKSGKGSSPKGKRSNPRPAAEDETLEGMIPDIPKLGGIDGQFLRAVVKVSRGMFRPGLHMYLTPVEGGKHIVSVRLQEGRPFLDSDAEILFARYGMSKQEWTVVGSIGHYSSVDDSSLPTFGDFADGNIVSRRGMIENVNRLMQMLGARGFSDFPQYPGFSIVPLAVYRTIPVVGPSQEQ